MIIDCKPNVWDSLVAVCTSLFENVHPNSWLVDTVADRQLGAVGNLVWRKCRLPHTVVASSVFPARNPSMSNPLSTVFISGIPEPGGGGRGAVLNLCTQFLCMVKGNISTTLRLPTK